MNERSQIDLNGFLYILVLPLMTTALCNHDKITLRAETQMRMMKHKGDESDKSLQKRKKKLFSLSVKNKGYYLFKEINNGLVPF